MTLDELNNHPLNRLKEILATCCGSSVWAEKMCTVFPVKNEEILLQEANKKWLECDKNDWLEAFTHHPKIGDMKILKEKFSSTNKWAQSEQSGVSSTTDDVLEELAAGNQLYEKKFGYIFIVCATGKSAKEMLHILNERLTNAPEMEISIAMNEQNKITALRIKKLLAS